MFFVIVKNLIYYEEGGWFWFCRASL